MKKLSWGKGLGRFWGAVTFEAKRALLIRAVMEGRDIEEITKQYIQKYFHVYGDAINRKHLRRW